MTNPTYNTDAVLRVADTKLVLGNVCIATVFNGRSIGDFATLLAISGTALGAARALYRLLEQGGSDYGWLEHGRDASEIASAEVLDSAPESWADLMVTIYLTEAITSAAAADWQSEADPLLANQARMIARDSAFHSAYCLGWLKIELEEKPDTVRSAFVARMAQAMRWIKQCAPSAEARFLADVAHLLDLLNESVPTVTASALWDKRLGRSAPVPSGLWEIVRFKDVELAR